MSMRRHSLLLAVVVTVNACIPGEGQEIADFERVALFTQCAPVGLFVYVTGDIYDSFETMTEALAHQDLIYSMAENRLWRAGLYQPGADSDFYPDVSPDVQMVLLVRVSPTSYAYTGAITKRRYDRFTGGSSLTTRLPIPHIGTHGDGAPDVIISIVEDLTESVDELIGDYLRVNEGYC